MDINCKFTIGEHNNSLLGGKVMSSDDDNHVVIESKIDMFVGDFHPKIAQTHEHSGQSWGINVAKDDFRYDNTSDVGHVSNIVLSDDGNFLVISYEDNS